MNILPKKTTTIYWSYGNEYQIRAEEPVPVIQNYFKNKDPDEYEYIRCPSFREHYKNTFGLKSPFEFDLTWDGDSASTNLRNQAFYDEIFYVRNWKSRNASLFYKYFFITDEPLEMEYISSSLENNDFNKYAYLVNGKFDIGKYVRPLDCAFHTRGDKFRVDEGDIYAYVRFKTDNKIEFKEFLWNDDIQRSTLGQTITAHRKWNYKPLQWYYDKQARMKMHERTLKLVKQSLL